MLNTPKISQTNPNEHNQPPFSYQASSSRKPKSPHKLSFRLNTPRNVSQADLLNLFSKHLPILDCCIKRLPHTGENKHVGYISVDSKEAIEKFNGKKFFVFGTSLVLEALASNNKKAFQGDLATFEFLILDSINESV